MPSTDQVLSETAWHLRDLATDPDHPDADWLSLSLDRTLISAESTSYSISATMSLSLTLANLRLPTDLARSVSFCEQVSNEAGVVLTELHRFCVEVRAKVLDAAEGVDGA